MCNSLNKSTPVSFQQSKPSMSKLGRTLISIILLTISLYLWFQGSLLLIRIDSDERIKTWRFKERQNEIKSRIDSQCKVLDKKSLQREFIQSFKLQISSDQKATLAKKESLYLIEHAKREKLVRDNLIYFPELGQMWCLVPKAGSTSWSKAIINQLNQIQPTFNSDQIQKSNLSLQVLLKEKYSYIDKIKYRKAVDSGEVRKVLIVRHPFSRVASAYRDKLIDRKSKSDGMYFFQQYGVRMNRNFRKNRKANKKKEPTFDEFLDYLINTDPMEYDEHWKPISLLCGLCNARYDQIIYLEELPQSIPQHLKSLGFSSGFPFPKENSLKMGMIKNKDPGWRNLFKNVSNSKKVKLLSKFQDDFRLFGYSFLSHYL